jgi:hypothetical protein
MQRFILRFRGKGTKTEEDVERIRSLPETTVLDDSSSRMLLVESSPDALQSLIETMPDWTMTKEQTIKIPDPRPKIREQKVNDEK